MLRQDSVLIDRVAELPEQAKQRQNLTLSEGHRLESLRSAELWEMCGVIYLQVIADSARILHEEGQPTIIARGIYRVWVRHDYALLAS